MQMDFGKGGAYRISGKLAHKVYKEMRQFATRSYNGIKSSALVLQIGLRAMDACNEFRFREQTTAASIAQAYWRTRRAVSSNKKLKEASTQSKRSSESAEGELTNLNAIDMVEEKGREITALLHSLRMLHNQTDETNEVLLKEREAVNKENEEHPIIAGTLTTNDDAKKIEALSAEVKNIKGVRPICRAENGPAQFIKLNFNF